MTLPLVDHLIASWYDPGDNGFDIGDALDWVLVIAALYGGWKVLVALVRWLDARRDRRHAIDVKAIMAPVLEQQTEHILKSVKDMTKSIEPEYRNNGTSLTDVSDKLTQLDAKVDGISGRLAVVEAAHQDPRT